MSSKSNVNKVILIGHLGNTPELRYTSKGNPVANFSIATNRSVREEGGTWKDLTEWHQAVAWGQRAETCSKYLAKGHRVYLEGALQKKTWVDDEGNNHHKTEIIVSDVRFLNRRIPQDIAEPSIAIMDAHVEDTSDSLANTG